MATTQPITYKFNWGEAVGVIDSAPEEYLKIRQGSVCGMREIETAVLADNFNEPIATILYLVEAPDGAAIEIPERFLTFL